MHLIVWCLICLYHIFTLERCEDAQPTSLDSALCAGGLISVLGFHAHALQSLLLDLFHLTVMALWRLWPLLLMDMMWLMWCDVIWCGHHVFGPQLPSSRAQRLWEGGAGTLYAYEGNGRITAIRVWEFCGYIAGLPCLWRAGISVQSRQTIKGKLGTVLCCFGRVNSPASYSCGWSDDCTWGPSGLPLWLLHNLHRLNTEPKPKELSSALCNPVHCIVFFVSWQTK